MGGREEHAACDEQRDVCLAYAWRIHAPLATGRSGRCDLGTRLYHPPLPLPPTASLSFARVRGRGQTAASPPYTHLYLQLLVLCSRWIASFHWSVKTNVFHSGIKLLIGQPVCVWQNGVPQSMHRAACLLRSRSSWPSIVFNSFQSWRLRRIGYRTKERGGVVSGTDAWSNGDFRARWNG